VALSNSPVYLHGVDRDTLLLYKGYTIMEGNTNEERRRELKKIKFLSMS
jgi:hypothetical protein